MHKITSGGTQYPLHFGMLELEQYEELSGEPIDKLFSRIASISTDQKEGELNFPFSIKETINITHVGLNGGARKSKDENEYTRQEAATILEEGNGLFVEVLQEFAKGLTKAFAPEDKNTAQGNAPGPKKRASKTQK